MNRFARVCAGLIVMAGNAVHAQEVQGLIAGVRVRMTGQRATNDGVRWFAESGVFVSRDAHYVVLQTDASPGKVDSVFLEGVRRLELFDGLRSRKEMIATGAVVGGVSGTVAWLIARSVVRPISVEDSQNPTRYTSTPVPPLVHQLRNGVAILAGAGALVGALVGSEKWIAVPVDAGSSP